MFLIIDNNTVTSHSNSTISASLVLHISLPFKIHILQYLLIATISISILDVWTINRPLLVYIIIGSIITVHSVFITEMCLNIFIMVSLTVILFTHGAAAILTSQNPLLERFLFDPFGHYFLQCYIVRFLLQFIGVILISSLKSYDLYLKVAVSLTFGHNFYQQSPLSGVIFAGYGIKNFV